MAYLIAGVVLFALSHLAHRLIPGFASAIPEIPRKIVVALLLILSIWLIAQGWSEAPADILWQVPKAVQNVAVVLMLPAFILFFSTHPGAALRARMRHPQLTGFKLWATLHLIVNGDVRSLILFGGMLAWAVVSVILINKQSPKPAPPAVSNNAIIAWLAIPIGLVVWAGLLFAHESLFGVSPVG